MTGLSPNPWLVATSLTFLLPATLYAFQGNWMLYSSNVAVVAVSSIYHATKWTPLFYVDVVAANTLAILHTVHAIQRGTPWIPFPGILYCILMFFYGRQRRQFIWHPSFVQATAWHMSMHAAVLASATTLALAGK